MAFAALSYGCCDNGLTAPFDGPDTPLPMDVTRTETDSFGPIEVPLHALWGAQTARSLQFFAIGQQRMPIEVVHAVAWVKWAGALANR